MVAPILAVFLAAATVAFLIAGISFLAEDVILALLTLIPAIMLGGMLVMVLTAPVTVCTPDTDDLEPGVHELTVTCVEYGSMLEADTA